MSFDPYYKWLGIPASEQPPNHYRLLGLSLFETNSDAIDNAADRQMAHLRTFQAGPEGAHSQRLLNEIAAARLTLLDPSRRWAYDDALRTQLAATPMVVEVPFTAPAFVPPPRPSSVLPPETTAQAVQVQPRKTSATARQPPKDITVEIIKIIGGGIAGIVLATLLLRLGFGIDMTGMFPVEQPRRPPSVVKRPKPVERPNENSGRDKPGANRNQATQSPVGLPQAAVELPSNPTQSGTGKKGKNKPSPLPVVVDTGGGDALAPVDSSVPAGSPGAPADSLPASPGPEGIPFKVTSVTLLPRRLPAPSDAERQAAQQQLESAYPLTKAKEDAEKRTLAVDLLGVGSNRKTPPAERWVTLQAAANLAADAGDARLVAQAMDLLAQTFEPNVLGEESALLAIAARGARSAEQMTALIETSRATIQAALANHEYILARDLASAVRNASDRPAGQPYRKFIFDGQREIVRQQEAWYACQEALTKLATSPDDADANLTVAKWWILDRGDWDAALPYLTKTGRPLLAAAAQLDGAKGSNWLAIANAWYDAGSAEPATPLWLARARGWYSVIDKTQISGLDGAHLDRRLEELAKNEQLVPIWTQIAMGRRTARLRANLAQVVRRHCVLAMPFERADHFHDGKQFMICDRSGQANHGALYGVKSAAGQAGMALEFAGAEHFVECPDQPSLNPAISFTLCAWVRASATGAVDDIVSKEDWGGGSELGYVLKFHEGRPSCNFGNGRNWLWILAPKAAELSTWMHLAAVYDGQNEVLSVNGAEVVTLPASDAIAVSPKPLRLGRGPFDQKRRFHGLIDEVAIFDMALTAADLQAIIDLGRAGKPLAE
jgi:hypothetical protein